MARWCTSREGEEVGGVDRKDKDDVMVLPKRVVEEEAEEEEVKKAEEERTEQMLRQTSWPGL